MCQFKKRKEAGCATENIGRRWGGCSHGGFREYINAVLSGYTLLTPLELDTKCKQFELEHGRTLEARKAGNVAIDIDLVIYGNDILRPKDFAREFFKIGYSCI